MLLLVTALIQEARPLARALGLAPRREGGPVRLFGGAGDYLLAVSGVGAARSAAVTGHLLTRFPEIRAALNTGMAGAVEGAFERGQWVRIHAVRDEASGRLLIPDILDEDALPEAALLTVGQVRREAPPPGHLVDMEGSGFLEATRFFLPTDRVALVKGVSDYCTEEFDTDAMVRCFGARCGELAEWIRRWGGGLEEEAAGEPEGLAALREAVEARLRLTATQRHQLSGWLRGYWLRGGSAEAVLAVLPAERPTDKSGQKRIIKEVRDVLAG